MTTATLTLTEFLLARIAEDEAVAQAATPGGWHHSDAHGSCVVTADRQTTIADLSPEGGTWRGQWSDADHIARHDPARVLAECAAKRVIVQRCSSVGALMPSEHLARGVLANLAAVYADHPDYEGSWRP